MTYPASTDLEFRIEMERKIDAPIETVWDILLEEVGPGFAGPDNPSLALELEAFPGGRWYRNLGDSKGHLWAHVQAIRPPDLLELTGPLFMSMPVTNNVQYRLEEADGTTTLRLVHSAFGPIPEDMRDGMAQGWNDHMDRIQERAIT